MCIHYNYDNITPIHWLNVPCTMEMKVWTLVAPPAATSDGRSRQAARAGTTGVGERWRSDHNTFLARHPLPYQHFSWTTVAPLTSVTRLALYNITLDFGKHVWNSNVRMYKKDMKGQLGTTGASKLANVHHAVPGAILDCWSRVWRAPSTYHDTMWGGLATRLINFIISVIVSLHRFPDRVSNSSDLSLKRMP